MHLVKEKVLVKLYYTKALYISDAFFFSIIMKEFTRDRSS